MTTRSPIYTRIGPREQPRELLTWTHTQVAIPPTPAIQRQWDWPVPAQRQYSLALRTWFNTLPPGVVSRTIPVGKRNWPDSFPPRVGFDNRTWVESKQIPQPASTAPFAQDDWPNPQVRQARSTDLLTWVNYNPALPDTVGAPFRQTDWPNPTLPKQSFDLRTWIESPAVPAPVVTAPFYQTDWQNPGQPRRPSDIWTWTQGLPPGVEALTLPNGGASFDLPILPRQSFDLRTWVDTTLIANIGAPFSQNDWPNPQPQKPNLELRTWINETLIENIGSPFSQGDWPNPIPRPYKLQIDPTANLLTGTLAPAIIVNPFVQTDWPNPRPARREFSEIWAESRPNLTMTLSLTLIPNVVTETQAQATTDLTNAGFTTVVSSAYSDSVAAGLVISQQPVGGSYGLPGDNVLIVVSLGPQPVSAEQPAGRKVRYRDIYRVTIDGQKFEFRSLADAIAFLEKAKATAAKLAQEASRAATETQRNTAKRIAPPRLKVPDIGISSRELRKAAAETKREIQAVYEAALRDAEIAMLFELQKRAEDDDEALTWLM